jgi:hypothetical protein
MQALVPEIEERGAVVEASYLRVFSRRCAHGPQSLAWEAHFLAQGREGAAQQGV